MVDPPPTARIRSTSFSRATLAPSRSLSAVGLDMTPGTSTTVFPAASSAAITFWYRPLRLMEPPPYVSSTLGPNFANSPGSSSRALGPK